MSRGSRRDEVLDAATSVQDAPSTTRTQRRGVLSQIPFAVTAMRPTQWSKNALVLLAIVFARQLLDPRTLGRGLLAFGAFCLAASMVYIINDLADREKDRLHPIKRLRPLASGRLSVPVAVVTAVLCGLGAAGLTYLIAAWGLTGVTDPFLDWGGSPALFTATLGGYVALNVVYSAWLKHAVLWDVFIIAAGFVLRALAGAFAAPVRISPWFYLCATFLALFLALGKRRSELLHLSTEAPSHRRNLRAYTVQLLDQLLVVVVTCTLITYSLYTFQSGNASQALMITIPFVIFGVFRYLYLLYVKEDGDRPDELLWRDRQLLGSVVLCVLCVLSVLYVVPLLQGHPAPPA